MPAYPQLPATPGIGYSQCMGRCIIAVAFVGSESVKAECRNDNLAKHGGDSHIGIHVDFQRSLRASILTVLGPFDELVSLSRLGGQRDNSSVLVLCSLGSIISDFDSASRLWLTYRQRVLGRSRTGTCNRDGDSRKVLSFDNQTFLLDDSEDIRCKC